jgi:hypothetical protein
LLDEHFEHSPGMFSMILHVWLLNF